jgi:hypothetical protein
VHALALLFVELVTGAPPYGARDNPRIAVVDAVRPTPRAAGVDVGPLEPVLAKALALRPADRYAHAGELLAAAREAMRRPHAAPVLAPKATRAPTAPETAAPSSRTLRTRTEARVPRRQVVGVSVLATVGLALVGAGAIALAPRLVARAGKSAPPPVPSPSTPPPAARSLDSITGPELAERVRRAGVSEEANASDTGGTMRFRQVMWNAKGSSPENWHVLICSLSAYGAPEHPSQAERLQAVEIAVASYRSVGMGAAYGSDADSFALVQTSAKDGAQTLFDAVFGDVPLLSRGAIPSPRAQIDASAPATRLRDLSGEELESRLRAKGLQIAGTSGGAWASSITTFARGGATGMATIHRKDALATVDSIKRAGNSAAYAIDGDTLVIVIGDASFTTKRFLSDVLAGLGAKVIELRPPP